MIVETMDRVTCISHNTGLVLSGKSGKDTLESRVEFKENLWAKHSALLADNST